VAEKSCHLEEISPYSPKAPTPAFVSKLKRRRNMAKARKSRADRLAESKPFLNQRTRHGNREAGPLNCSFAVLTAVREGAALKPMTKAELIETLSSKLPMNKGDAESAINIVLEETITALKQGQRVNISGFGTFTISDRQARAGRNPKTGESIQISASRSAKFKPGKQLKDSLNEGLSGQPAASSTGSPED
jgi:nucleoid DNA-binding protein